MDAYEHFRPCAVCNENCIGQDFLCVSAPRFYAAGDPGCQNFLCWKDGEDVDSAEYVHRACASMWVEGMFSRLHSDAKMPGDVDE